MELGWMDGGCDIYTLTMVRWAGSTAMCGWGVEGRFMLLVLDTLLKWWCATLPKQQVLEGEALLIAPSQTLRKPMYPRFKWALRVLWRKEWMADLADYFCSLQTGMLGRQLQEYERQLRRLSLIDFFEGGVTSAAPSAERLHLSTFHFNQLPTAMFHMCFRWLRWKLFFPSIWLTHFTPPLTAQKHFSSSRLSLFFSAPFLHPVFFPLLLFCLPALFNLCILAVWISLPQAINSQTVK